MPLMTARPASAAVSRHLTSESTFDDMARATDSACTELVQLDQVTAAECGEIKSAWQSVGILSVDPTGSDCPDDATLRECVCECDRGFTPSADARSAASSIVRPATAA